MNQPLRAVTDRVYVESHKFDLEDADPANIEEPPSPRWLPRENLTVRQGIVYMRSLGHTHEAIVTMQAWAGEPARQPDEVWELTAGLEVVLRSGTVVAVDGMQDHRTAPHDSTSAMGRWSTTSVSTPAGTSECLNSKAAEVSPKRATSTYPARSICFSSGRPVPFRTTWPRHIVPSGHPGSLRACDCPRSYRIPAAANRTQKDLDLRLR